MCFLSCMVDVCIPVKLFVDVKAEVFGGIYILRGLLMGGLCTLNVMALVC